MSVPVKYLPQTSELVKNTTTPFNSAIVPTSKIISGSQNAQIHDKNKQVFSSYDMYNNNEYVESRFTSKVTGPTVESIDSLIKRRHRVRSEFDNNVQWDYHGIREKKPFSNIGPMFVRAPEKTVRYIETPRVIEIKTERVHGGAVMRPEIFSTPVEMKDLIESKNSSVRDLKTVFTKTYKI